jgi:HEAT repeat protein
MQATFRLISTLLMVSLLPLTGWTESRPQVTRREYVEGFMSMLGKSPYQLRRDGAWALGGIGPTAVQSAAALVARLSDRRQPVRRQAARSLVEIGSGAVPQIRKALFSPNPRTRWLASRILHEIGPRAREALDRLRELSLNEDEDPRVRRAAWRARVRLREPLGRGD